MYIEAVAVLVRQETHFRVLRALRPVFFINTHLMFGVQRFSINTSKHSEILTRLSFRVVQQVFLCLKPISDVLLLLLFQIAFFSIIGKQTLVNDKTNLMFCYNRVLHIQPI